MPQVALKLCITLNPNFEVEMLQGEMSLFLSMLKKKWNTDSLIKKKLCSPNKS